jgi:hypothetical protein
MERFAVLVVLLVLVGGSRGGAQTPLLEPADGSPFDVSGSSGQVLLADVNDDGHLDLLTRHQQASLSSSATAEHFREPVSRRFAPDQAHSMSRSGT